MLTPRPRWPISAQRVLAAAIVILIATGACSPSPSATVEPPAEIAPVIPTETSASPAESLGPLPSAATSLPTLPVPTPTIRPGMEATDPTSVVLAAGKPTLVEFFAFW